MAGLSNCVTVERVRIPHADSDGFPCPSRELDPEPSGETAYCARCGAIAGWTTKGVFEILGHGSPFGTDASNPAGVTFGGFGP